MKPKRSLADIVKNNKYSKFFRNYFNLFPIFIDTSKIAENSIVSDSFAWRIDNDFETIFKFSDIIKLFTGINGSSVILKFYDYNNKLLKIKRLEKISLSNKVLINNKLLDQKKGYGYFTVLFHNKNFSYPDKISFSNRCYLGFSKKKNTTSMVHGNSYVTSKTIKGYEYNNNFINTSFLNNQKYLIQNSFLEFDYSELFFVNPTSKKIKFKIGGDSYSLRPFCSKIITVKKINIVEIVSNCYWLRPIVFNYKKNFIDVYHS